MKFHISDRDISPSHEDSVKTLYYTFLKTSLFIYNLWNKLVQAWFILLEQQMAPATFAYLPSCIHNTQPPLEWEVVIHIHSQLQGKPIKFYDKPLWLAGGSGIIVSSFVSC